MVEMPQEAYCPVCKKNFNAEVKMSGCYINDYLQYSVNYLYRTCPKCGANIIARTDIVSYDSIDNTGHTHQGEYSVLINKD